MVLSSGYQRFWMSTSKAVLKSPVQNCPDRAWLQKGCWRCIATSPADVNGLYEKILRPLAASTR
jgi:hypothetical protein